MKTTKDELRTLLLDFVDEWVKAEPGEKSANIFEQHLDIILSYKHNTVKEDCGIKFSVKTSVIDEKGNILGTIDIPANINDLFK